MNEDLRTILMITGGAVILSMAIVIPIHWNVYKHYHYICSKCSRTFKPNTFIRSMFALNGGALRKMRCPYCGHKDWMEAKKDNSIAYKVSRTESLTR